MMKFAQQQRQQGFTIIELMIATTVFSVVLLVCLGGFLYVSRLFYKGITLSKTSEVSRNVLSEIENDIRFSGSAVRADHNSDRWAVCIGAVKYVWADNIPYNGNRFNDSDKTTYGLIKSRESNCDTGDYHTANPQQLLNENMRVASLAFSDCNPGGLCAISVKISYGSDDSLFDPISGQCVGSLFDTQFCATAELQSAIYRNGSD